MKPRDNQLRVFHFESSTHSSSLLAGLCSLWNQRELNDVTLVADGQRFSAQRVVLAACSDYFRAMFTDGMKECSQTEIELNGVDAVGLCHLLEYIYTSKIVLTLGNIQQVLGAASHLQILPVVEACSKYLRSQLDLDNSVDILTIGETYSLHELTHMVYCFLGQNLERLAPMPEFQQLSAGQLLHFLMADFPIGCREADVLQILLSWISHDLDSRSLHAPALFRSIRFQHITRNEYSRVKRCIYFKEIHKRMPNLSALLHTCISRAQGRGPRSARQALDDLSCLINPRGFKKAIVNIGGFNCHRGLINDLTYLHPDSTEQWKRLTSIPHVEQCDFGVAVLDNELYVIGGCFNQSLQEHVHPFGFKYNPRQDKWITISPMLQERCRFYLGAVGRKLYAVGGMVEQENFGEEIRCEMYNVETDMWTQIVPLPTPRSQHSGTVIGQTIYVCGGLTASDVVSSSFVSYCTDRDEWRELQEMLLPRADFCMSSFCDRIFVAGGWYEDVTTGDRVIASTVDCYSYQTDQWQTLSQMPTPRYHASMTVVDGTLYVIGGFGEGQFNRATRKIETYDTRAREWKDYEDYPVEIWEHSSCVLFVPTCRKDVYVTRQSDMQNLRHARTAFNY